MSHLKYGIDTIDIIINSLKNTKEQLENKNLLEDNLYGSFEILSTIYSSIEQVFGSEELNIFQKEYITSFLELLKTKISNDYFNFSTEIDDGFYIIKVYTTCNNQVLDLFYINPYFKSIILIKDEYVLNLQQKLNILYENESEILSRINIIQNAKINPTEYTKDSLGLYAKSMFNKKGFEKDLNQDLNELQLCLLETKREISELEIDLETYNESLSELDLEKTHYIQFLVNKLNFSIIDNSIV